MRLLECVAPSQPCCFSLQKETDRWLLAPIMRQGHSFWFCQCLISKCPHWSRERQTWRSGAERRVLPRRKHLLAKWGGEQGFLWFTGYFARFISLLGGTDSAPYNEKTRRHTDNTQSRFVNASAERQSALAASVLWTSGRQIVEHA